MERLIEFLGDFFFKASLAYENFFEEKVKRNDTTMIAFLMIPLLLLAIVLVALSGFISFEYKSAFLFFYPLLGLSMLIFTAGYYRGIKKKKSLGYNFKMIPLNFSKINFQTLGFNESDIYNLNLLYRNRKVENKINNTNLVKNKSAASYSFLFSLFHVMIKNGIKELNTADRKLFLQILEDSFTMKGDSLNSNTIQSNFSKWKSKVISDENYLNDLALIKSTLNIK
ncbi:MAG: hypothetical protein L3J20_06380 [Flavobacteriaceae bacterium]|nr:hypothetical protein [Flavobacteriaceae bacterium]